MRRSEIKRFLLITLVIATMLTVFSPSAFCTSPSPTPTGSATTSPSPSPTDSSTASPDTSVSASPTGSTGTSPSPSGSGFQMLMENSKGSEVVRVQMRLRELGYFNLRATGNYFKFTINAVTDFQKNNGLDSDGRIGEQSYEKLFALSGLTRRPKSPSVVVTAGKSGTAKVTGQEGDWATINAAFTVSSTPVKVTDCITGDTLNVVRTGGTNLAEVETATADDYTAFKNFFGGKPNWEKRAVVVTINGTDYAASLFGNPSGADTIANNGMTGHTTLYFYGSTTDVSGFADKEDLKEVMIAAGKLSQ